MSSIYPHHKVFKKVSAICHGYFILYPKHETINSTKIYQYKSFLSQQECLSDIKIKILITI